jgi:hypothetical protein
MPNSKNSNPIYHEYATVNTAPAAGGGGYFTNIIYPRKNKISKLFFSIRETTEDSSPSVITVKLQYKCAGDTGWSDYLNNGEDWDIGIRVIVEEFAEAVTWRAGVKEDSDYTSGSVTFGFDW